MLSRIERRRAGVAVVLDLMTLTESRTQTDMARAVGVSCTMPSQWAVRKTAKAEPVGISVRTMDAMLERLPAGKVTAEMRAKLHRMAARTCGYEV